MNDVQKIAKLFVQEVLKRRINVNRAYLFGSYAKGKQNKFSDIDICVVSPDFGKDYIEESLKLKRITNDVDFRISPVPMTPEDMNNKYSTLATEIKNHGIQIL